MNDESQPREESAKPQAEDSGWARDALRDVALEGVRERRRARRWGIFFKLLFFGYLVALLLLSQSLDLGGVADAVTGPHTAVVDIEGTIASDSEASAETIIKGLRSAFEADGVRGVMLRINSPGGSPVESSRVNREIRRLREANPGIPVYAVAGDLCASGAYYIAVAADRIYVDASSLVGSVGVIMGGFGFTQAMDKLGVERRLYTAGRHKGMLDPFSPARETEVQHVREMLDRIHQQFIQAVRDGRGERLADSEELFSGLIWTGDRAVELGLVDEIGSPGHVAREVIGAEKLVNYSRRPPLLQRLADRVGAAAARVAGLGVVPDLR